MPRPPAYPLIACSYASVQPLHRSWQQYMQELLAGAGSTPGPSSSRGGGGGGSSNDVEARLYAADLHGCLMRVSHTAGGCDGSVCRVVAVPLTHLKHQGFGQIA